MKQQGILNSDISRVLSYMGHMDTSAIREKVTGEFALLYLGYNMKELKISLDLKR